MAEQVAADRALVQVSNPLLVMISVITMGLCVYLDQTIANVALPHMRASLGASPETISWVLTSFIIATAITAPITGWMVDKLGSRMVYLGASALFLASSAACGAASSLSALVLFRMLQGVATGFIAPMTQMILFDISKPSEQAFMTSTYSAVAMVVPVSGPFVGAFLTDYLSWRWCFFINLVVGLPALVALAARLPTRPRQHRPLDVTGYASLAIAVGAFQMMLDRGQGNGWFDSTETIVEAVLAGGALWVFVVHSFFAERPLFPRALMRDSNFVAGCLQMMAIGMTVTTVAAILPTMLQTVMGWPVVFTGEAVAPRGFGTLVSTVLNGWLMRKIELRVLIAVGFAISAASTATMTSWSLQLHSNIMFWALLVQGIGMGLVFAPLNLIAFGGLETKYRPDGASLLNLCRNIGASAGISACVALIARTQQISHAELATHVTAMTDLGRYAELTQGAEPALRMIDGEINRQAMMIGYLDCFKAVGIVMLAMVPVPFFLKRPKRRVAEVVHLAPE
jgi:DHA2 family multidrug resistance protein